MNLSKLMGLCVLIACAHSSLAAQGVEERLTNLRYVESSSRKKFDLRPLSVGFESTDWLELSLKIQIVSSIRKKLTEAAVPMNPDEAERRTLGIFDANLKTPEDFLKHYTELQKQFELAKLQEGKRIAQNIALRWTQALVSNSDPFFVPFKSTDTIEIELPGELSAKNLREDLAFQIFATKHSVEKAQESIREEAKAGPINVEREIGASTDSFSDLDVEKLEFTMQWDGKEQDEELMKKMRDLNGPVTSTVYKIAAPQKGWPKNRALVVLIMDNPENPNLVLPLRAFFKTLIVSKD